MRIGILGAGSIGCYVGGRLAANGHDVQLLGRQALVDEVKASGVTITPAIAPTAAAMPRGTARRIHRSSRSRPTPRAIGAKRAAEQASTVNQNVTLPW